MDIQTTKIELIKKLLEVKKESVLNKIQDILSSEIPTQSDDIVAYTADGNPLSKQDYINRIKEISKEIENGAPTYASEEVQEYVLNRKQK